MRNPIMAFTPIFNELDTFKFNGIEVFIVYGDRDWMDTDLNIAKVSDQLIEKGEKVFILQDSNHHLYLDNPKELLGILQKCMYEEEE